MSEGPPDDRFLYLSDILPTAWQGVEYADVPKGGSLVVLGLGPVGDFACRIAQQRGIDRVVGVDLVPERLERQRRAASTVLDVNDFPKADDLVAAVRELTDGRGPDAVIDAVGMEAHGSPAGKLAHQLTSIMPDRLAEKLMTKVGRRPARCAPCGDRHGPSRWNDLGARVYGGMTDPMPMMTLFDKQIQLRMGQANVRRWVDDILPLLNDDDPLGVDTFATHHVPLRDAR